MITDDDLLTVREVLVTVDYHLHAGSPDDHARPPSLERIEYAAFAVGHTERTSDDHARRTDQRREHRDA